MASVTAVIKGVDKLIAQLRDRAARARKDADGKVVVGFTAQYAIWVHENVEMKWRGKPRRSGIGTYWGPKGQAKFLEQPARELRNDGTLASIVKQAVRAGKTIMQGLVLAGLRLQRESQMRVPVEYANLRQSAFTRLEDR